MAGHGSNDERGVEHTDLSKPWEYSEFDGAVFSGGEFAIVAWAREMRPCGVILAYILYSTRQC